MEPTYTTHDVAQIVQVDPSTVSKWVDKGLLLAYRTPGGHRRVRESDLRVFLRQYGMPVPQELGGDTPVLLVVDDEPKVLRSLERAFRSHGEGLRLVCVSSAIEALLLLNEVRPDAVLLDLFMPDVDGFEICRRVRARKTFANLKLLAMTARYDAEVEEKARDAGANACFAKPVDVAAVLALLRPQAAARAG